MRNLLNSLNLPCLLEDRTGRSLSTLEEWENRRKELKELLQREEYGYFPPPVPFEVSRKEIRKGEFSGFTTWERLNFHVSNAVKCVNIPVNLLYPENTAGQIPFILFINFRPDIPDRYLYVEDIIEKGFGVATFCYSDVSSDSADWDGLCDFFCAEEQKTQTTFGKIGIWSYMAQRVMDYLQTLDFVDKKNIAVMGHSRLGKCALLTAAFDERFAFACVNNSGCCGASISRGKGGETIADITERFGYWFCSNLKKYSHNEFSMPFDQHFLLALVAPRKVCIGTAELDTWADTDYQLLNCIAADEIYKLYGSTGYIGEFVPCNPETYYTDGDLAFFNRTGTHFMSIRDWRVYMDYILTHKNG